MNIAKILLLVVVGFGSGVVISGAVFAFITIVGVIPRLAQKTKTEIYAKFYENIIILGGIFGGVVLYYEFKFNLNSVLVIILGLCEGIFIGCLAISLAEVLDVLPILTRRVRVEKGLLYFMLAIAIGKMVGSLLYYFYPGFKKV